MDEQRAIAGILADINDEIDLLKRRLAKARATKTGMMQELLTGCTRLLVKESAA
jgi:type I restriction enzyme S subunit